MPCKQCWYRENNDKGEVCTCLVQFFFLNSFRELNPQGRNPGVGRAGCKRRLFSPAELGEVLGHPGLTLGLVFTRVRTTSSGLSSPPTPAPKGQEPRLSGAPFLQASRRAVQSLNSRCFGQAARGRRSAGRAGPGRPGSPPSPPQHPMRKTNGQAGYHRFHLLTTEVAGAVRTPRSSPGWRTHRDLPGSSPSASPPTLQQRLAREPP